MADQVFLEDVGKPYSVQENEGRIRNENNNRIIIDWYDVCKRLCNKSVYWQIAPNPR